MAGIAGESVSMPTCLQLSAHAAQPPLYCCAHAQPSGDRGGRGPEAGKECRLAEVTNLRSIPVRRKLRLIGALVLGVAVVLLYHLFFHEPLLDPRFF